MRERWGLQRACAAAVLWVLATATIVVLGGTAQAAVSAPSSLSPSGVPQSAVPALAWAPVRAAVRYEVHVSSSPSFDSLLLGVSTENRKYVPTLELPTQVFWRVRSVAADGSVSSWSTASFGRSEQAGPTLQSPEDGKSFAPQEPPVLSWSPIENVTRYEVSIDNDPDFVDASVAYTGTTSYIAPDPQPATKFWWRVRGISAGGLNTEPSSVRSYTVGGLDQVTTSSPTEQETVVDVVFDWEPVAGARDYELRVSEDRDFNTLVPGTPVFVKSTRYSPQVTYNNDEYYWQVRARDNSGNSPAWAGVAVRHFQRHWPGRPTAVYPANDVTTPVPDPFYLEWTPVEQASRYELHMGTDQNFTSDFTTCYTRATTFTPGAHSPWNQATLGCTPQPGRVYYWRVRGEDGPRGVHGLWSETRAFVYDPGVVTPVAPANGSTVALPTLQWNAVRETEKYQVTVRDRAGNVAASTETYSLSWTPTGKLDPAQGPFRWDVVAIKANGHRSASLMTENQWTFNVSNVAPTTGAAALAPLSGDTVTARFPSLSWEPHPDAAYYKLYVGVAGAPTLTLVNMSWDGRLQYTSVTDVGKAYLNTGRYDWVVEAYDANNGYLGRSPGRGTFTIRDLPPVTGQRVALTGSALDDNACDNRLGATSGPEFCSDLRQTPVLDWEPSPEASHYRVYLYRDRDMTNGVYGTSSYVETQNTRWTPTELLPDSQAGDAYFWYVSACKRWNGCGPDPTSKADSATHAFDKASVGVDLVAPAAAEGTKVATVSNELTLTWQDNLRNVQEHPQVLKTGGTTATPATVEAQQYRVQVSDDRTFGRLLVNELVDQTTFTPHDRTLPEGPLYWRVQAVDGSGNALTWSAVRSVDKRSPTATPASPAENQSVSGTPHFRWSPLDFASGYRLEVYKDNDSTLSPANLVISKTTRQAAYAHDQPLPVAATSYLWRVQRLDADNRGGRWSPVRSFRVTGGAPTMGSPATSAYVDGRNALFSWQTVQQAAAYRFERRPDGSPYNAEDVRTNALSWAPTARISDGRHEWRVSSVDSLGRVISTSRWRAFAVDSVRPTVRRRSPVRSPVARDVNFSVTFSEPVRRVSTTTMRLYREGARDPVAARITASNGRRTWTLNPTTLLPRRSRLALRLHRGITDAAGNPLTAVSWAFTSR